jgi:hypothetical protein
MKKKPQRVPDFSTAKRPAKGVKGAPVAPVLDAPAPIAARTVTKPPATASKSGHRGK